MLLDLQQKTDIKPNTMMYYKVTQIYCKHMQNEQYLNNILSLLLLHIMKFQCEDSDSSNINMDTIWKLLQKNLSNENYKKLYDYYLNTERQMK